MKNRSDDEGDDVPWLRDMADEDLLDLFTDDESILRPAVRGLVERAKRDADLEDRLLDLLDTSLELRNDDTSASFWTTVILGEIGSTRSVPVLLRSLASDEDEALQDAARVALLRIGAPAMEAVMDAIDEEENPALDPPGYELLGMVGILEDEALRRRAMDYLESRVSVERRKPRDQRTLDSLFRASALLGDRRQIEVIEKILAEDYGGRHAALRDALEMLEENVSGLPIKSTVPPWEDRYGWLFEEDARRAQVERRHARADEGEPSADESDEDALRQNDLSMLYWGLSSTAYADLDGDVAEEYDARRFLKRPTGGDPDEEEDEDEGQGEPNE